MENYSTSNKIFDSLIEDYVSDISIKQLKQSAKLLRAQYHVMKALLLQINPEKEPREYETVKALAIKLSEIAVSVARCAFAYEYMDSEILSENEV